MKNIFFFDIDGTLLDTPRLDTQLSPALRSAINSLQSQGHIVAACTARQLCFIEKWMPNVFDCVILMNGSYVKANDTILLDAPFSAEDISQINHYFEPYNARYIYIGNSNGWAYNITPNHQKLLDDIYMVGHGYTVFKMPKENMKAYLIDMFFETPTDFERVQPAFRSNDELALNYCYGDFTGDVSFRGRSKATAIRLILDYYMTDISNTYAFGDGINDLSLFKLVQHTCAVGNARPELKKVASYVSNKRAGLGVLQGLRHWGFLT